MKYGLTEKTVEKIRGVLVCFSDIDKAVLYGSRAKGNYKTGSDIDLTLYGEMLTLDHLSAIAGKIDDLLLPYTVDLSIFDDLNHAKLQEHIKRVGVMFYHRDKKGWQTKTLAEVCQFSNGLWKGEKPPFVNVGVIRNTNFTKEGTLDDSDIAFLDVEAKKLEKRRLRFGDIILEKSGGGPKQAVGRVALFDKENGDFSFSNFTAALRVLEPDEIDFRFLHKFLHWTYVSGVTEGMQSHSTGIRNLDGDAYKAINFNFPPLHEQQRIVGILDEAFEGIAKARANAEKNLQNARALFESHLQSVFTQRGEGWVETTVSKISTNLDSKRVPITKNVRTSGEYPYYGASGIVDYVGDFIFEGETLLVSEDGANLLARSTPIAFSVSGKYWVNNHAHILKFENMATQRFTEFYLGSIKLDEYITGAAQPKLNQKALNSIPIPIPKSVEAQAEIVESVESLQEETQRLVSLYQRKLAALTALKKSLLHQAFSGQL
jgi:type I restriction enzyme S subunit